MPDLDGLWWRDVLGPVPLTLPDARGDAADPDAVAAALSRQLADGPVAGLGAAIGAAGGVSEQILWANVASATAGAVRMLAGASPTHARVAYEVGERMVDRAPLSGTGAFTGAAFRRSTCCVYYKVPGGGYCGDCVLPDR